MEFPDEYEVIYNPYKRRLSENELLELIKNYQPDGMIAGVEPITRSVLKAAKNLKVISRCGVGMDSIDMETANELKIKTFNTPEVPVIPVAELTVGMIYSLVRGINSLDRKMKDCVWEKKTGGLIAEKTIGILGCGRIGTYVAKLLQPSGARLIGFDTIIKDHTICEMVSFQDLIEKADILTLHIPITEGNKNLINEKVMASMKSGSIIINTSRGGLVDEDALCKNLLNKHISGCGIDVFEKEPYSGPLCGLDNVILTPHIASSAGDSRQKMELESLTNLVKGLKEFQLDSSAKP